MNCCYYSDIERFGETPSEGFKRIHSNLSKVLKKGPVDPWRESN
jgi:hypothetical protein